MLFICIMHSAHDELAAIDLNLLRALDVLLTERHVTRAAARLGISQSAASHALARLRELLGDPLLVRGRRGAMLPTARGEALTAGVHRALGEVAAVLRPPVPFDPSTVQRTFHIGASDFAELVLLPELVARVAAVAPGVDLFVRTVPKDQPAGLASGEVDAILAPARSRDLDANCYQRLLFEEGFVCAMRKGHPAARRPLTVDRYCALEHLLIAPGGTPGGFVDDALALLGRRRRVALAVPHFLIVPHILVRTDLIITVGARIAAAFADTHDLVTVRPPVEVAPFGLHVIWHQRTHGDDAQRWLREQIVQVAATEKGPTPGGRRGARAKV
jgi:DNA-binding transcriptional LysR family regulator